MLHKISFTQFIIMDNNEIDYKRAAEHLRKGELLFGKDSCFGTNVGAHFKCCS